MERLWPNIEANEKVLYPVSTYTIYEYVGVERKGERERGCCLLLLLLRLITNFLAAISSQC